MLFKHKVFTENLRLTLPFFEKNGVKQPRYGTLMRNMLSDALDFLLLYNKKKRENFIVDKNSIQILEEMRCGGIFLTAHYGNHELLGYRLAELNLPLNSASIVQKPLFFNKFLEKKRSFKGKCFAEQKSPHEMLKFVDGGGLVALLADQDFRKACPRKFGDKCKSVFLGVNVRCNPLPLFVLEHRKELPVFCGHLQQSGKTQTLYLKKINAENLYDDYHSWLESLVLKNPAKWYGWIHRRFKLPKSTNL